MGNKSTTSNIRNAIVYLNITADSISASDDKFWSQIFHEEMSIAEDVVKNITVQEIRCLRDGSPKNFATLAYKMVERLCLSTGSLCNTQSQQTAVMNAIRILIRIIPCIFEDKSWRLFFAENYINESDLQNVGDVLKRKQHHHNQQQQQPKLRFPEKSANERNYVAYLPPLKPSSRTPTPTILHEKQQQSEQASEKQDEELLLNEQLLSTDLGDHQSKTTTTTKLDNQPNEGERSLMQALVLSICDLLFCPEFTVLPHGYSYLSNAVDTPPEDLKSLSTHDYVWEPGVGFDSSVNSTTYYDRNRSELLRALLVCFSGTLYETPERSIDLKNIWLEIFVCEENRHALPIFTSLLNVIFGYKPARPLLQLNNTADGGRERLVELSSQLLIAVLDYQIDVQDSEQNGDDLEGNHQNDKTTTTTTTTTNDKKNLFIDYLSRIHRNEDLIFMSKGFTKLFNHGLQQQGYLWTSPKSIELEQELQLLFWKTCNYNKKFIQFLLQSNEIQDIVVPILYHLNENFQEPSKTALIHIGVFNLLILSSERNFGVRLNKPYTTNILSNLPDFSGSHVDLMIIVFHKLIMYGYQVNQLYDYMLTILVNISPYIKGMTVLAAKCLIQLFETFSSPLVIFTEPNYHQLIVFLLEIFNNIIQYQFDGNSNLVYILLSKKELFIDLAHLPTTQKSIDKVLRKLLRRKLNQTSQIERNILALPNDDQTANISTTPTTLKANEKSADNQQSSPHNNNNNNNDDDDQDLTLILATVSSPCTGQSLSSSSSSFSSSLVASNLSLKKQEVSLVATPDLNNITQPTYPFDKNNTSNNNNNNLKNDTNHHPQRCEPKISLDDILNDMSSSSSHANDNCLLITSGISKQLAGSSNCCDEDDSDSFNLEQATSRSGGGGSPAQRKKKIKWRPTGEWLEQWKKTLPLQTILRMISALNPQIEQLKRQSTLTNSTSSAGGGHNSSKSTTTLDECDIIKFLQNGTLVGLLPVPHPILIRKYHNTNDSSTMWFRTCSWGIIYVRSTIWTGTDIKLIKIL